jgi:3-methyladenine DNA glycosylase AlkD
MQGLTSKTPAASSVGLKAALAALKRRATKKTLDSFPRYGIHTGKAFGVAMGDIQAMGKQLGRDHDLAAALWDSGWYEARLLASYVEDPARVTSPQMDRWCRDFDNWGICDTVCFTLFDRTPHAWPKIAKWSRHRDEFVKRAAFALLASVALHDKRAADGPFLEALPLIERAAGDERNFVKKGVSWGLRSIGRRNAALHAAALELARRLSASPEPAARWVGKDALKDITRPAVARRVATRRSGG